MLGRSDTAAQLYAVKMPAFCDPAVSHLGIYSTGIFAHANVHMYIFVEAKE